MTTIPKNFAPIDVPLPPMLLEMAGVTVESRFIFLYYQGSKSIWNDGRSSATFPFYTVWQPFTEHLVIAIHLFDADLGSDDSPATHALMCDRAEQKVYVAPWSEAVHFVERQHPPRPPLTQEQWEAIKAQLAEQPLLDITELQNLGMFEVFLPPKPEHQQRAAELVEWLDEYIDDALIRMYVEAAKAGDYRATWALEQFGRRYKGKT